jgi:hypothetical protein
VELLRLLIVAVVSIPTVNDALSTTPDFAQARAALLRPGDSPNVAAEVLGLRRYTWSSGGNAGEIWFSSYHDPRLSHFVSIHYRWDRATNSSRLIKVEVSR